MASIGDKSSDNVSLPDGAYTEGDGENQKVAVQWMDDTRSVSSIKHVEIDGWTVKWKTKSGAISRKWTGKLLPWKVYQNEPIQNSNESVFEPPNSTEKPDRAAIEICILCTEEVTNEQQDIRCDDCKQWWHGQCLFMPVSITNLYLKEDLKFKCPTCIMDPKLKALQDKINESDSKLVLYCLNMDKFKNDVVNINKEKKDQEETMNKEIIALNKEIEKRVELKQPKPKCNQCPIINLKLDHMGERFNDALEARLKAEEILKLQRQLWELRDMAMKRDQSSNTDIVDQKSEIEMVDKDTTTTITEINIPAKETATTITEINIPAIVVKEKSREINYNKQFCLQYLKNKTCGDGRQCNKKHALICRNFQRRGDCKYKDKCIYYHPSKKCHIENCNKGEECQFKHDPKNISIKNPFLFSSRIPKKPPQTYATSMQDQGSRYSQPMRMESSLNWIAYQNRRIY